MRMSTKALMAIVSAVLFGICAHAQKKPELFDFKPGKVSAEDFKLPEDAEHKEAAAYIIADIGETEFLGNAKGWFSLKYNRKVRVLINKSDGVDAADFVIPLYHAGQSTERIINLKASAYNLENGAVQETKLDQAQVFNDKIDKNIDLKKFSVPGAKAGSLVEVRYTIESDFIRNLQPWEFQGKYPRYWSRYDVGIPDFFKYAVLAQGMNTFHVRDSKENYQTYNVLVPSDEGYGGRSQSVPVQDRIVYSTWVMKNVPALKEEPYTTSLDNHIAKIEFQLSQIYFKGGTPQNAMSSWTKIISGLNEDEQFGYNLYKNNNFVSGDAKAAVATAATPLEKAQNIYKYVRENYTCTAPYGKYLTTDLKGVLKAKSGNVADINLLLVSMLNDQGIKTVPVILSTRSHGFTHPFYPLLTRYNYVIARAEIDGKHYMLDASEKMLPFGELPGRCYNGFARVMEGDGLQISLAADSVQERNSTLNVISMNESREWKSKFSTSIGGFESHSMRKMARESGNVAVEKLVGRWVPGEYSTDSVRVMNLDGAANNVKVEFHLTPQVDADQDMVYIRPFFGRTETENPFASGTRNYPVEMPYAMNDTYVCTIDIPEGFEVEELPKSERIELNEDGMFEYIVAKSPEKIALRSRLVLKKANYAAEEYENLRSFFTHVVQKYSEQVVIKKKANP